MLFRLLFFFPTRYEVVEPYKFQNLDQTIRQTSKFQNLVLLYSARSIVKRVPRRSHGQGM